MSPPPPFVNNRCINLECPGGSLEKLVGVTWLPSLEFPAAVTLGETSGLFLRRKLLKSYWKASGLSLLEICYLPPISVLAPAFLG